MKAIQIEAFGNPARGSLGTRSQLRRVFIARGKDPGKSACTLADNGGRLWTSYHVFASYLCKFLMISPWRRRGSNPCFQRIRPARSRKGFFRENSERVSSHGNAWMALDVISFVIRWPAFGNTRNRGRTRHPSFFGRHRHAYRVS
jgi:hypothetical protein